VKYIIEKKQFPVDVRNNEGSTPLLMAISNRHIELTRYLLRQNASVNAKNIRKYNPLHAACNNASVEITSELIDKYKADIHAKTIAGFSPLHFACSGCEERRSLVQLLLHRDTSVEAQDSIGRTSLFLAASRGNSDIVRLLLSHSANPLVEDRLGNNLIHMTPSLKVIRILVGEDDTHDRSQRFLAYTLLTKTNSSGETPIQAAKRRDTFRKINPFLQKMRYRYLQSFTVNPIAVGSALRFNRLLTPVQLFFADKMLSLIQKLGFLEEVAYAILGYLSPLDVMRVM
jgi:ankyrin repeat protein